MIYTKTIPFHGQKSTVIGTAQTILIQSSFVITSLTENGIVALANNPFTSENKQFSELAYVKIYVTDSSITLESKTKKMVDFGMIFASFTVIISFIVMCVFLFRTLRADNSIEPFFVLFFASMSLFFGFLPILTNKLYKRQLDILLKNLAQVG
ncbi:MAG: hypothetical protein EA365_09305 [Gloeocapsa sp. DLM2.Bin57]|nr:MAG: hypothetical protein EA365_09305 [Gloeocapsa sp. DLM2.Bin57]